MKNFIRYYKSLSILNKFLLPSILGIIFFVPFYLCLLSNTSNIKNEVQKINYNLLPLQEIVFSNKIIIEKISSQLNSAVVSKEIQWASDTKILFDQFNSNFEKYSKTNSFYKNDILTIKNNFEQYYLFAYETSKKLITTDSNYDNIHHDTSNLINKFNILKTNLNNLNNTIKKEIELNINNAYAAFDIILLKSMYIFTIWFILSFIIIYFIYKDFSYNIKQIVKESEKIASEDATFDKRLCYVSHDEFGKIIKSFNIFIDKLHNNHLELKKTKEKLIELSITDQLTGVFNRRKIDEILKFEIKKSNRYHNTFSIILIDIDHFKSVNDTYGHMVGDIVLKEFSTILKNTIRDLDILGRWGGEEFIIVCMQTDLEGATLLAEKLRKKIKHFNFDTVNNKTASFGVATSKRNTTTEELIDLADKALYRAKNTGRDKVVSLT